MTRLVLRRALAFFLPAAVAATLGCGLIYAVVQQDLRSGADDPQIQLAEDAARALDAGVKAGGAIVWRPRTKACSQVAAQLRALANSLDEVPG